MQVDKITWKLTSGSLRSGRKTEQQNWPREGRRHSHPASTNGKARGYSRDRPTVVWTQKQSVTK